jgi:hypothetical protein
MGLASCNGTLMLEESKRSNHHNDNSQTLTNGSLRHAKDIVFEFVFSGTFVDGMLNSGHLSDHDPGGGKAHGKTKPGVERSLVCSMLSARCATQYGRKRALTQVIPIHCERDILGQVNGFAEFAKYFGNHHRAKTEWKKLKAAYMQR